MTSEYSDIISNSIIALLKRDIRRVIFIKEKLFGQQLPILLRQFVWTECLLRFEMGSLDYDLVNISFIEKINFFLNFPIQNLVEFQTRRDFAAGVTRGKHQLKINNPSQSPITNLIENAVIEVNKFCL